MSWQDGYSVLARQTGAPIYRPPRGSVAQTWESARGRRRGWGGSAGGWRAPRTLSWNDLASGSLAKTRAAPAGDANPLVSGVQEKGLDKFQFNYPISSAGPRSPYAPAPVTKPQSTQGDFIGSLAGSAGSIAENLTFGNAIPYFMEGASKAAHALADANIPVVSQVSSFHALGLDAFEAAIQGLSDVVSPVLEAGHNYIRDSQLGDRAKLLRGLHGGNTDFGWTGAVSNPLASFGDLLGVAAGTFAPGLRAAQMETGQSRNPFANVTGRTVSDVTEEAIHWQNVLLTSVDPQRRLDAKKRMGILAESIDLPESVKTQIAANPQADDEKLSKWLDEAPEGRQWSYQAGPTGIIQNFGNPLLIYGAEMMAGYGVAGAIGRGGVAMASGTGIPRAAGIGLRTAGQIGQGSLKVMTAATAFGLGAEVLPLTAGAVARYVGNEAEVEWWDRYNEPGEFANSPNVQFMTSFAVNPFKVVPGTTKVFMAAKHGGGAMLDAATAGKLKRLYTTPDLINDRIAQMHRLGSGDEAAAMMARNGWSRQDGATRIVDTAAQVVLTRLPDAERLALTAEVAPAELLNTVMTRYGERVWKVIDEEPHELVAENMRFWTERLSDGPFNAESMMDYGRRYRQTSDYTAGLRMENLPDQLPDPVKHPIAYKAAIEARFENRLVVTKRNNLPPEGAALARRALDEQVIDGKVTMEAWQQLQSRLPVLGMFSGGRVRGDATTIPRETLEQVIVAAEADFKLRYQTNPVGTATGHDPILAPDSVNPTRDTATAIGTSQEVIAAIQKADVTNASDVQLARELLYSKLDIDQQFNLAKLEPEQVFERAQQYLDETAGPWRRQGTRLSTAGTAMEGLRQDLARLWAMPRGPERDAAIAVVEADLTRYERLLEDAIDPQMPFTARVRMERQIAGALGKIKKGRVTAAQAQDLRERLIAAGKSPEGTPNELLERVRALRDDPEALAVGMAERASTVVAARDSLERLYQIDLELDMMSASAGMFARVEGSWMYSGGMPHLSREFRANMAKGLKNAGHGGAALEAQTMSDYDLWRYLLRDPERVTIMEALGPRQRRMVDAQPTLARGADEHAQGWGRSEGWTNRGDATAGVLPDDESWSEAVIRLLDERDTLLGTHKSKMTLESVAGARVGKEYIDAVEAADDQWYHEQWDFENVEHPRNIGRLQTAIDSAQETPSPASTAIVRDIITADPLLYEAVHKSEQSAAMYEALGLEDGDLYLGPLRQLLVPADFVPPTPGVALPRTALDEALLTHNQAAIQSEITEAAKRTRDILPLKVTRGTAAKVVEMAQKRRQSTRIRKRLTVLGADLKASPRADILAATENRTGVDVMSAIIDGKVGRPPSTVEGVIIALREIENGNAARKGIGAGYLEEGRRVAGLVLKDAEFRAKQEVLPDEALGLANKGFYPEDELELAESFVNVIRMANPDDPFAAMTYSVGRPPKDAVLREWSQVPGLAEEFLTKHFVPFEQRVGAAHVRQAWNWVFGPHANAKLRAETRVRFIERLGRDGIGPDTAESIWKHLYAVSHDSRLPMVRRNAQGSFTIEAGDFRKYADITNIPNAEIQTAVLGFPTAAGKEAREGALGALAAAGKISNEELLVARSIDYADAFRESSSFIRRTLADSKIPLGEAMASAYGRVAHNAVATTYYYWLRFMLDPRFHAMNYLEARFLGWGRAGARPAEIDEGMFGMGTTKLRDSAAEEQMFANGGYPFSQSRLEQAERVFIKEQPDADRRGLRTMQAQDEPMVRKALNNMIETDRSIADEMIGVGEKYDAALYMKDLDAFHKKMLANVDGAGDAKVIEAELAAARKANPELAQLYDHLAVINNELWDNIRQTFYGNPNRSRAERFLNSYLLFWPLSYQIKSAKWFARVLFDRAGGLPTNAGGAYLFDKAANSHNQLLATDPEYAEWFEKHPALVRTAQMFFPVSLDSTGVTLNPILRAIFFDRDIARFADVGPIYTVQLGKQLLDETSADLYPTLKDVPVLNEWFRPEGVEKPPSPTGDASLNPFGSTPRPKPP